MIESYIHFNHSVGVLVEVNCETDFVANTDEFRDLARDISLHIASAGPLYVSREEVPADVVEAEDVVGVAVGEEDGVEFGDAGAEGLVAEVGRGIDDDIAVVVAQPDGGAEAVVTRVGGGADVAIAADGRDADGGAGTEDGEGDETHFLSVYLNGCAAPPCGGAGIWSCQRPGRAGRRCAFGRKAGARGVGIGRKSP